MESDRIIEITPELERRVLADRRREPREKLAGMERRLAVIASILRSVNGKAKHLNLEVLLELAEGRF